MTVNIITATEVSKLRAYSIRVYRKKNLFLEDFSLRSNRLCVQDQYFIRAGVYVVKVI